MDILLALVLLLRLRRGPAWHQTPRLAPVAAAHRVPAPPHDSVDFIFFPQVRGAISDAVNSNLSTYLFEKKSCSTIIT